YAATYALYTLSRHDALPISWAQMTMTLWNTWYPLQPMTPFFSSRIKEKFTVPKGMKFLNSAGLQKAYRSLICYRLKKTNGSTRSFRFPNTVRITTCSSQQDTVYTIVRSCRNVQTYAKAG